VTDEREFEPGLVSVVLVTTGERDIGPTLESLRRQVYETWELIEVRDEQHRGAPWARNQGEKRARGEFLLFLDDDVELDPLYLGEMVRVLARESACDYAYCHYERRGVFDDVWRAAPFDPRLLRRTNYISTMSLMRHVVFEPWDERLARFQDWDMWLTLLERGSTGVLVDQVLFIAHYGSGGITGTDETEMRRLADVVRAKHGMLASVAAGRAKRSLVSLWRRAWGSMDGRA